MTKFPNLIDVFSSGVSAAIFTTCAYLFDSKFKILKNIPSYSSTILGFICLHNYYYQNFASIL